MFIEIELVEIGSLLLNATQATVLRVVPVTGNKFALSLAIMPGKEVFVKQGGVDYYDTRAEAQAAADLLKAELGTTSTTGGTETDPIFTAWNKSTGISITKSQVSDLIEATQALSGLMSATDKTRLDALHALLEEDTANNVVDSINEVLAIFNNYPEGADLVTALAGKVDKVTGKGLSTNDLTDTLKSNYDTAYTHSQSTHAPSNAQKNSNITKAEIEAKLTGEITSHSHALPPHNHDSDYYKKTEIDTMIGDIETLLGGI